MPTLKPHFLLDPTITYLNHGSFGATPRPVFNHYQQWQRRLERQPVHFINHELTGALQAAREALGELVNAPAADLVYVPNATFAINVVARSLPLGPGDEVLTGDHEYGACNNVWHLLGRERGFRYVQQPLPFPPASAAELVETFWQGVTPRTRVIFLSHLTSPTALLLPVAEICARARTAGILTVIDGAHTVGQIPLDLQTLGADFYTSNAHKWLCAPKGSAFLHTRPEHQPLIKPLVVSWGWGPERALDFGSDYLDKLQWLGTDDLSSYLAVPAAIHFQAEHDWPAVRRRCHTLLRHALARIAELTGLPPCYPDQSFYAQMAVAELPRLRDPAAFQEQLYRDYRIEIPCYAWHGRHYLRLSIQGYNTPEDVDTLLTALETLLPHHREASTR